MTPKQLAAQLNGREYGEEITKEEEKLARENNLVVVFGYSDDNMELRGAITDEVGCYDGGACYISPNGILPNFDDVEEEYMEQYINDKKKAKLVTALWDKNGYSWVYATDIPHETFDILEDGEKYCRGLVFSLDSI
jgi:hypothetical protein